MVLESSDEDLPQPKQTAVTRRKTATSEAIRKEQEDLENAIQQSLAATETCTEATGRMVDDRGTNSDDDDDVVIVKVQWVLMSNWVAIFIDHIWQNEKLSLFDATQFPPLFGKHGIKPIVKCMSYCIWRNENHYELVCEQIVRHFPAVWTQPKIQVYSKTWFLKKTKQYPHIPIKNYNLTVQEYIDVSEMAKNKTYGGSTELETAAQFLQTPIRVYCKSCIL